MYGDREVSRFAFDSYYLLDNDYMNRVKLPMIIKIIFERVFSGWYKTEESYKFDVQRILENAKEAQ